MRTSDLKRLTTGWIFAGVLLAVGCAGSLGDQRRTILVFTDWSCTMIDRSSQVADWQRIVADVRPGDRVILGAITNDTASAFRPVLDVELPHFNQLTDNRLRYQETSARARRPLASALALLESRPCTSRSPLLDTVQLGAMVLAGIEGRRVMVILSDMVEDSSDVNFTRTQPTRALGERVASEHREAGRLPDLRGVFVYVASGGGTGSSGRAASGLRQFWAAYLGAAGADFPQPPFMPALVNFERPTSTPGPVEAPEPPKPDGRHSNEPAVARAASRQP